MCFIAAAVAGFITIMVNKGRRAELNSSLLLLDVYAFSQLKILCPFNSWPKISCPFSSWSSVCFLQQHIEANDWLKLVVLFAASNQSALFWHIGSFALLTFVYGIDSWTQHQQYSKRYEKQDSGCGSVSKAVTSNTRGPRFKPIHRQNLYWTFV